jgi:hypothetical protein
MEVAVVRDPEARPLGVRVARNRGDTRRRAVAVLTLLLAIAVAGSIWLIRRDAGPTLANVGERGAPGLTYVCRTVPAPAARPAGRPASLDVCLPTRADRLARER